jgi:hypothetical protein
MLREKAGLTDDLSLAFEFSDTAGKQLLQISNAWCLIWFGFQRGKCVAKYLKMVSRWRAIAWFPISKDQHIKRPQFLESADCVAARALLHECGEPEES